MTPPNHSHATGHRGPNQAAAGADPGPRADEAPPDWTRRRFLATTAALAAAGLSASPAEARRRNHHRAHRRRPAAGRGTVAVLGGGVAGLSAAHELAARGFSVTVVERRALGGKARSMAVPRSASGGRQPLPGEHGMRTFPGFYVNLPDTLARIPFGSNAHGVFDNLVGCSQLDFARASGRADLILPLAWSTGWTIDQVRQSALALLQTGLGIPPQEAAYFVQRLLVFFSSCDARRYGQWERTTWSEFTAADRFSTDYQRLLAGWINRELLAAKASDVSALTVAILWEQGLYNLMGRSGNGPFDRVLNLPTNQAWIDPWIDELKRLGVRFEHAELRRLVLHRHQIAGALVGRGRRGRQVRANWYVLAVPAERAAPLLGGPAAKLDPRLEGIASLRTAWENGIQFYLRQPAPIVHGHVLYVDSPWGISSISQQQFWSSRSFARDYGNGAVKESLSIDIADWDTPGGVYNKPARACSPAEIAREVWTQLKDSLNDTGGQVLSDDMIESWFLDPGLVHHRGKLTNQDPLMISTPGSWSLRPPADTAIPNLFLAADYVQTNINTASMEGANEAARRAVNALLEAAGSRAAPAPVLPLYAPPEFEALRSEDAQRYANGQPNLFDTPPPPALNLALPPTPAPPTLLPGAAVSSASH